ncbi:N-acetylglucosamine kinase [Effusibacillus consociatus]|uniref:N-acetylglucosamine kinase n=1 Tax=Effusibacillus consociatus TaxID=1117041 RepID=A0ABV9PXL2_9BACL
MKHIPVLAVDAGATNCRAVICDEQGKVLGYRQGGACNHQNIGADSTGTALLSVLSSLVPRDQYPLHVKTAVFGMAGLDTDQDRAILETVVREALKQSGILAEQVLLDNDGIMTLLGAVRGETGVLVVCGTGSIACGITRDGKRARAGGWGHRIGDEGSGYAIGKAALVHVLQSYDGREKISKISDSVLQELSLSNPEELMAWVYSSEYSIDRVAALTSVISELGEEGDWKARSILQEAGRELAKMALAVIENLHLRQVGFDMVLSGGVLRQSRVVREQLIETVRQNCPAVRIVTPRYEPICGVVLSGLRALNIDQPKILDRLSQELSLFGS